MKPIPPTLAQSLAPRILAGAAADSNGCLVRFQGLRTNGYSVVTAKGVDGRFQHFLTHRVMFVHANGSIPDGLEIDHLCENRACCNPEHLRAVSHRENVLRSALNPMAIHARKTVCNAGHEFHLTASGKRRCRECDRLRAAERYRRRKAAGESN